MIAIKVGLKCISVRLNELSASEFFEALGQFRGALPDARWDESVRHWVLPSSRLKAILDFSYRHFGSERVRVYVENTARQGQLYLS
jgi:hypothetical protein